MQYWGIPVYHPSIIVIGVMEMIITERNSAKTVERARVLNNRSTM